MMVNKQKRKGSDWERLATKLLNESFPNTWHRIPTSGAIGTAIGIPILKGDLRGKYDFLSRTFVGEAKVGYGGTQMKINKEWFDKIQREADETYSLPLVLLKFEKARSGVRHVVAMSFDTWDDILEEIESTHDALIKAHERIRELEREIYTDSGEDREES